MSEATWLRWIPLLPLGVALFHAAFVGWFRRSPPYLLVAVLSCGAVMSSFVLSCLACWKLVALTGSEPAVVDEVYTWFGVGVGEWAFSTDVAFRLDPLAAVMCLLITGVGSVIHVHAAGSMRDDFREDAGAQRFFCYLGALTAFALVVVLAEDLIFLLLGWQGVGVATWLLVGFWYGEARSETAARCAFLMDRFGDAALLLGGFLIFTVMAEVGRSGFSFQEIEIAWAEIASALSAEPGSSAGNSGTLVRISALCLLVAAAAKSAQFPLHVWLRGVVEGPVPASALIHSSATLAMGVYLLCRLDFVFVSDPVAADAVAWLGALTALLAVSFATTGRELNRVLSHLALSQVGLIFLAFAAGMPAASVFHLVTCAFSLALLFLVAGSTIRVFRGEREMDQMGGLIHQVPVLAGFFGVGALALSGFPALSGFFSRDLVLLAVANSSLTGRAGLYAVALIVVAATAFSVLRCFLRVFLGEPERKVANIELPRLATRIHSHPLYVLAFLATTIGFLVGLPQFWGDVIDVQRSNSLANFLRSPVVDETASGLEHWMVLLGLSMTAVGYGLAWVLYVRRPELRTTSSSGIRAVRRLLAEECFIPQLYQRLGARPFDSFARPFVSRVIGPHPSDGRWVSNASRALRLGTVHLLKRSQTGPLQVHVFVVLVGVLAVVGLMFLRSPAT
ncbi:NADH-quinone oxidoreductase subunit L [Myxococcota bacterium]|nr:NADH-quinone oxidoreductase subunit L [Myxococcota bacterium]